MRGHIFHRISAFASLLFSFSCFAAEAPLISIIGAEDALQRNILNHLRIGGESCDTRMDRLLRLQNQVADNVQRAANALGYYKSEIDINFSTGETCWNLEITISPGEPVLIGEVNVALDNESVEIFNDIINSFPLMTGQQLNHGQYEALKNNLSSTAIENGYFAARFLRSELAIDLVNNTANINLIFAPGPRYLIGEISMNNSSILSDDFVSNLLQLRENDPYSNTDLVRIRNNLDQSQYFSQVSISPQLSQAQNLSIPLTIDLAPRPRHEYSAGIGFTTDTGPRIRIGYENRYQTRNGHRLDSEISLSEIRQQGNINYTMPIGRNPLRESIQYSIGYTREDNETFENNLLEFETSYRNESESGWLRNTFINYQRDNYTISQQSDLSYLALLGFGVSKTQADDLINPSRGWKIYAEISGASDAVISDASLIQTNLNGKLIRSLSSSTRALLRFDSGFTWIDDKDELPASLRFLSGGDQSLRGYKYETLGPVDEFGVVVGGKHMLTGTLEMDYLFRPRWRIAMFVDAGNAFNEFDDIDWKQSVGLGVRWLSPIGPLRFDVAHTIGDDEGFRIHITMGPDL